MGSGRLLDWEGIYTVCVLGGGKKSSLAFWRARVWVGVGGDLVEQSFSVALVLALALTRVRVGCSRVGHSLYSMLLAHGVAVGHLEDRV